MSEPESRLVEAAALDLDYEPRPWAFAETRAEEIATHWARRRASLPRLFDGRVLLLGRRSLAQRGDGATVLRGTYFATDFKAYLAWRDFGCPDPDVCNCFSMAALRSSDGAFLLGEMAGHTANGGSVYFASGTPDPSDIFNGRVDLAASARRELQEEMGVAAEHVAIAPDWTLLHSPQRIACMKTMRMAEPAAAAKARIEAFLARDANAELQRVHIVRREEELDRLNCPSFVRAFITHELRRG